MTNWKFPAVFAGFGAVVSLLAGIIGGNPFGVILLRLILSAVVCGGLGLGVILIVKKFLPELSANPPAAAMEPGEEVDIVIDEDIPLAEEAGEQQRPGMDESLEQMETEEAEQAEELTRSVDEEEGAGEQFVPGTAAAQVADFEELDTLPDIERFSPTPEDREPPARPSRKSSQVEEVVRDQDPENLARAVRTFMKKDQ
jgi:hypothetical protein